MSDTTISYDQFVTSRANEDAVVQVVLTAHFGGHGVTLDHVLRHFVEHLESAARVVGVPAAEAMTLGLKDVSA